MSAVSEVKQRTDIVDVIGQYTKLTKSGRMLRGLCPFHAEKTPSFFVYPEQQSWHCFGACGTGGDVFSFIMKKENMTFGEALELLARRAGVILPEKSGTGEKKEDKEAAYQVNEAAALYFHNLLLNAKEAEAAREYVTKRDFSGESVKNFQLGYSPNRWEDLKNYLLEKGYTEDRMREAGLIIASEDGKTHDRFRNRLMFPIFDARGRVIGFGARALDDSMPKYLNSPQSEVFDKGGTLYALNFAAKSIRDNDLAVIVEGYADVITAHQHGFTNVVASMGTSITENQVLSLKKLSRNLVLALDADNAGEEAMLRGIQHENVLDAEIKVLIMPEGKDPDDFIKQSAKSWQKFLTEANPLVDLVFSKAAAGANLKTAGGQQKIADELLPVIGRIENPVRQAHYLQELSRLSRIPIRTLEIALQQMKKGAFKRAKYSGSPAGETKSLRPLTAMPREEYFLALLLQHPELKSQAGVIPARYFRNSENREIFLAWQQVGETADLKEILGLALHDHVDTLMAKGFPPGSIEERYADLANKLAMDFFRSEEALKAEILASEAESGGAGADLAKLEEMGCNTSSKILESYRIGYRNKELRR